MSCWISRVRNNTIPKKKMRVSSPISFWIHELVGRLLSWVPWKESFWFSRDLSLVVLVYRTITCGSTSSVALLNASTQRYNLTVVFSQDRAISMSWWFSPSSRSAAQRTYSDGKSWRSVSRATRTGRPCIVTRQRSLLNLVLHAMQMFSCMLSSLLFYCGVLNGLHDSVVPRHPDPNFDHCRRKKSWIEKDYDVTFFLCIRHTLLMPVSPA